MSGIKRKSVASKSSQERTSAPLKKSKGPDEEIEFPLSMAGALIHYKDYLNDYEKQEIKDYDNQIYYVGQNCKTKIKGHVKKYVTNLQAQPSHAFGTARRNSYLKKIGGSISQSVER